ncbi:MAG: hypothetical protein WA323_08020 [Candidatus Nitrosopolaris sp.]
MSKILVFKTPNVAVGIIFNVEPPNSGKIMCDNVVYPTNTYLYVNDGTNCMAQPNKDFEFNTWAESPLTNRNSSVPLDSSGNLTLDRYGMFTVNFKPVPPLITIPSEFLYGVVLGPTVGAILGGFLAWYIPYLINKRATNKNINKSK